MHRLLRAPLAELDPTATKLRVWRGVHMPPPFGMGPQTPSTNPLASRPATSGQRRRRDGARFVVFFATRPAKFIAALLQGAEKMRFISLRFRRDVVLFVLVKRAKISVAWR
jgi:hypothetical protein